MITLDIINFIKVCFCSVLADNTESHIFSYNYFYLRCHFSDLSRIVLFNTNKGSFDIWVWHIEHPLNQFSCGPTIIITEKSFSNRSQFLWSFILFEIFLTIVNTNYNESHFYLEKYIHNIFKYLFVQSWKQSNFCLKKEKIDWNLS